MGCPGREARDAAARQNGVAISHRRAKEFGLGTSWRMTADDMSSALA